MENIITKYGDLQGIINISQTKNDTVNEYTLDKKSTLKTPYGELIPLYKPNSERHKYIKSVSFYTNGNIESIYLQAQTKINTPVGIIPAELITFYESGNIKRVFPLNGKITAYWSEEDEYNLAEDISLNLTTGKLNRKLISLCFFESGKIKSITLWPKNFVTLNSPIGTVSSRIGLSFFENGSLSSFEPKSPTPIETKIGIINAFDSTALGIHGDSNSVKFSKDGVLISLTTPTDQVEVTKASGSKSIYRPLLKKSVIDDVSMEIIPLKISFDSDTVIFNNFDVYNLNDCTFKITKANFKLPYPCSHSN